MQQRQCQGGARAFAQAQPEGEQRSRAQMVEHRRVAMLVGAVREHAVVEHPRLHGAGREQGAGDDEAVDQQGHARLGRGEHGAGDQGDLESAEGGEHLERCARVGVQFERSFDHGALAHQARVVDTGATPGAIRGRKPGQAGHQRAGRGAVADAHFTECDQRGATGGDAARELGAGPHGLLALRAAHRGFAREVARTHGDLAIDQRGVRLERMIHAGVDHGERHAVAAREQVDSRALREIVHHHLPGHFGRIRRYAFGGDAMVARGDQQVRRRDARCL